MAEHFFWSDPPTDGLVHTRPRGDELKLHSHYLKASFLSLSPGPTLAWHLSSSSLSGSAALCGPCGYPRPQRRQVNNSGGADDCDWPPGQMGSAVLIFSRLPAPKTCGARSAQPTQTNTPPGLVGVGDEAAPVTTAVSVQGQVLALLRFRFGCLWVKKEVQSRQSTQAPLSREDRPPLTLSSTPKPFSLGKRAVNCEAAL